MNYRDLGSTGMKISEISFGTWAIGGSWGNSNDTEAVKGLERAVSEGVNFFDTADVYGDGHAEELLGRTVKPQDAYIASKFCRSGDIHDPQTYSENNVRSYLEATLRRLKRDELDLYQIHCPPKEIIENADVFAVLDKLKQEGKIKHYGVSVETVEEGLLCLEYPGVSTLQVIYNIFRQKPAQELFPQAVEKNVGILARVPLASGLLTGKFKENHQFENDDHRNFNADGEHFNVGETFGGIPFSTGVALSRELDWISEGRGSMTRASLKWVLEHEAVSAVIPGFKREEQVSDSIEAVNVKGFRTEEMERLEQFYDRQVHDVIRGAY
ncbi:aldo/keto reductase [Alkalicoccus halolimnae]|uniref:Aldo/keto reductase n=1 Tax=Alkalicoccus halolimnae TaxID=1667239 RepID=A0A5C7F7A1_9BACI|nr:aldo/keto reductase [Alkalicoccus halolimnae]TXF86581.1 aldo/keto reductase [Alkalicoccus halolimnae]